MKPLPNLLIILFHTVDVFSTINCPVNETEWKARSNTKVCQGSDVYHCLLVEDGKTRKEKCIERTTVMDGHCPIFTHDDYLHWKICNTSGCPSMPFRSDDVYKYPVCFYGDEENDVLGNQNLRRENNNLPVKIGIPVVVTVIIFIIIIIMVIVMKRRRTAPFCLFILWRNKHTGDDDDLELGKLIKKPEYISICIRQLKTKNILYVIGHLGNSVSTAGKTITKKYAKRHKLSYEYFNYLDVSDKFSELSPEQIFKPKSVNFIDGWCGLWNENPCERRGTVDTLAEIVKQSKTHKDKRFVIGLRTEVRESLKEKFNELGIRITENERLVLDSSSNYKRQIIEGEIESLQRSCSEENCECKSLDFEQVSGIDIIPIGTYLVVKLIRLDHNMIPEFLDEHVGPLKAVRNHFERLMESEQTWSWLPYFVCLGYHDKNEFRQEIADEFAISENMVSNCENISKYTKRMEKLSPMWSERFDLIKGRDNGPRNVLVFWHNFLYICAFHACYKKYPIKIMRFCNLDAILQLVRPKNHPDPFTIQANDEEIDLFCEERIKNLADDSLCAEHPLIQDWENRKEN